MIYKEPTIYKSGFDPATLKENDFLELKILDKYNNIIDDTRYSIAYNKSINLVCFSAAVHITKRFTPHYEAADGVGTNDWPAIGYCEIEDLNPTSDENYFTIAADPVTNDFFSIDYYLQQSNNKIAMCTNRIVTLPTGWKNILSVSFFV